MNMDAEPYPSAGNKCNNSVAAGWRGPYSLSGITGKKPTHA